MNFSLFCVLSYFYQRRNTNVWVRLWLMKAPTMRWPSNTVLTTTTPLSPRRRRMLTKKVVRAHTYITHNLIQGVRRWVCHSQISMECAGQLDILTPKFHQMRVRSISAQAGLRSWLVSLQSVCVLPLTPLHCSSSLSQLGQSGVFCSRCARLLFLWSTTQHFCTEQTELDRKSDAITSLKHLVIFQYKTFCVDARSYFT